MTINAEAFIDKTRRRVRVKVRKEKRMKKLAKLAAMVMAAAALFSVAAFAAVNREDMVVFSANSVKVDSGTWAKPNDGDPYGYVTTVAEAKGGTSTVFPNGGTVYARLYCNSNPSIHTSSAWEFHSNTQGGAKPYNGSPQYGQAHFLRSEIENTRFTGQYVWQGFRWCP